jgi:hypothetical protein
MYRVVSGDTLPHFHKRTSVSQPHVSQDLFSSTSTSEEVVHVEIRDHLDFTTVTNELAPGSSAKFDFSDSAYTNIVSLVVRFWAAASSHLHWA